MPGAAPVLSIRNLQKYYENHRAVDGISFDIPGGGIFGLLGPNGAGKTTLLRMITGIIYPDAGEIFFKGMPFDSRRDIQSIGYMPEERGLYKKMQVGEQLLYLAQLKGMSLGEARSRAKAWIRKLDLQNWWGKKVGDLSKGMQQKVQFISTVIHEPPLLILDEPFSGLDPINTNLIKEEIFALCEKGTTVIFSTHRMEQVEEICRDIVLVNKGKKILDGAVEQIKQSFKKHEFSIMLAEPPGALPQETDIFTVKEVRGEEMVVKLREGRTNNELLQYFIHAGLPIQRFYEILPSINNVFIEQVARTEQAEVPA